MSVESQKVVQFCISERICTRCKCKPARSDGVLCVKCTAYILKMRNPGMAKKFAMQHKAI